jgi:hypothetical protein
MWHDKFGQKFLEEVAEGKRVFEYIHVVRDKTGHVIREEVTMLPADPRIRVDVAIYLADCGHGRPAQMLSADPEAADAIGDILEASRQRAALRVRCEQEAKQLPET